MRGWKSKNFSLVPTKKRQKINLIHAVSSLINRVSNITQQWRFHGNVDRRKRTRGLARENNGYSSCSSFVKERDVSKGCNGRCIHRQGLHGECKGDFFKKSSHNLVFLVQVASPPKAGALEPRPYKPTDFKKFYDRGDFPIALEHDTKGNKIAWKVLTRYLAACSALTFCLTGWDREAWLSSLPPLVLWWPLRDGSPLRVLCPTRCPRYAGARREEDPTRYTTAHHPY